MTPRRCPGKIERPHDEELRPVHAIVGWDPNYPSLLVPHPAASESSSVFVIHKIASSSAIAAIKKRTLVVFPACQVQPSIVADLSPLSGLTELEELNLNDNRLITDISPLAGLERLEVLNLEFNDLADLGPLAGLTRLWWLKVSYNRITDISYLTGLARLRGLYLGWNTIADISPLRGLSALENLDLRANEIREGVDELTSLTKATYIDLRENRTVPIGDIESLTTALGSDVVQRDEG